MSLLNFFQTQTIFFFIIVALLGLIIGSFLNVVIYRYPLMLKNLWRRDSQQYLGLPIDKALTFNLSLPRSHCPHCQQALKPWHNIPLFSFLFLRGRCAFCKTIIPWIYPFVEALSAFLAVCVAWRFGVSWQTLAGLVFTWNLIAMSGIDFKEQVLPDNITLPLLWLGLLVNCFNTFTSLFSAVLGAIIGYLVFWVFAQVYARLRHRQGLGFGDCKMLAMLGAWFGLSTLLPIVLMASVLALIVSAFLLALKKMQLQQTLAFGPYLAIGGWLVMIFYAFLPFGLFK